MPTMPTRGPGRLPKTWLLAAMADGWRALARQRRLARRLFGVDFLPVGEGDVYFDVTTPLLVRVARRWLGPGSRLLDMGTGAYAVVGLALWRQTGCQVLASDIHPHIVEQAREGIALNRAPIRVVQASFFDGIDQAVDVVAFNPPYVPSHLARSATFARPFDFQSDGGADGTSVVVRFLDAFAAHPGNAVACLTINGLFTPAGRVQAVLAARPDLRLADRVQIPGLPFYVFVIQKSSMARASRPEL